MSSKFEKFWNKFIKDVNLNHVKSKEIAEEAWNAAVDAVDENITHRSPELDQDIWQIYT